MVNKSIKCIIKRKITTKKGNEMYAIADGDSKSALIATDKVVKMFPEGVSLDGSAYYEGYIMIPSDYIIKWEDELNGFFKGDAKYLANTYRKKTQMLSDEIQGKVPKEFTENMQPIEPNPSTVLPPITGDSLVPASSISQKSPASFATIASVSAIVERIEAKLNAIYDLLSKTPPKEPTLNETGINW